VEVEHVSDQSNAPAQPESPKLQTEKFIKNEKIEKFEFKEKPEKFEHKEKPEKFEHKEKPEKWEHKEKPEKFEHKEKFEKFENKELEKFILENNPKDIAEGPIGNPGEIDQRVAALEQSVASLQHFITSQQRPDLSRGALSSEPAAKKPGG
jgi:hypothetical protein